MSKSGLQATSGIVGAVAAANVARCIVCAPYVAGCIVCPARAAHMAGCIVIDATTYSAGVLIFFSHAARMTDTMLRAVTTAVASGIISAATTPTALSGGAFAGRGAAGAS